MHKKSCSGQILLVGVLIIALLLLSTEIYVYDLGKAVEEAKQNSFNDFVLAVRLGSKHVVVGSLANVSQGGANQTLEDNLKSWSSFVGGIYQSGKCILNFTLIETAPYSSGIQISWGTNGSGVSSACANFTYKLSDREVNINQSCFINVTTSLLIESTFRGLTGNDKEINVTINLLNEREPALANQITVYYKSLGSWLIPDETNNYTVLDYGNGTYLASFVASIPDQDVEVSADVVDKREIHVQANATCTEV